MLTPRRSTFKYGYAVKLFLQKQITDLPATRSNADGDVIAFLHDPSSQTTLTAPVGQQFDK